MARFDWAYLGILDGFGLGFELGLKLGRAVFSLVFFNEEFLVNRKALGWLYSVTVFVSSAMLLVLEIVAGRLLAPYVGVSLYTWTSIIGIILAGLSLGNWFGGIAADKGYGHRAIGMLLVSTAITSILILPLLGIIASQMQTVELDLASASIIYVFGLFFVPSVLIGILVPLITTLYLNIDQQTGKVVGRMHALAALGSILGTFATGLVLVQWLGTRNIILLVSVTLFFISLPFLFLSSKGRSSVAACLGLFMVSLVVTVASPGFVNPCSKESNYYCLRVVDENDGSDELYARTLVLDHMVHSTNIKHDPTALVTPYIQVMDAMVQNHFPRPQALRFFFAGGGAYTHPRSIISRFPNANITVSEIDPAVTNIARSELFLDTSMMKIHHGDTRNVLKSYPTQNFDVVITDVFHDVSIPYHLTTLEHAKIVKNSLSENGLYLANVIDVFPQNRLIQSMTKTLKTVFPHVQVWVIPPESESARLTYLLTASNVPSTQQRISIPAVPGQEGTDWYQISDFVDQQILRHKAPLLTDDFAPVERLLGPLLTTKAGI